MSRTRSNWPNFGLWDGRLAPYPRWTSGDGTNCGPRVIRASTRDARPEARSARDHGQGNTHAECRFQGAAVTAGATLLLLTALGAQALAAKSTKTVNATATLTSLVNQTRTSQERRLEEREGKLLRRARRARRARSRPCTALRHLAAYRKTLRATRIRLGATGKAKLRAKLAGRSARRR